MTRRAGATISDVSSITYWIDGVAPKDGQTQGLLFFNAATGQMGTWTLATSGAITGWRAYPTPTSGWVPRGVADYNADGFSDILFQNVATGALGIWSMGGTAGTTIAGWIALQTPTAGWVVLGVADFNGDGQTDILFQNTATREMGIWVMNGTTVTGWAALPTPTAGWVVRGIGDFDGDGRPDILFQNTAQRSLGAWTVTGSGTALSVGWITLPTPAAGWVPRAVSDVDGDGRADIVFQNATTSEVGVWTMNGTSSPGWLYVGPATAGWSICGTVSLPWP